MKDTAVVSCRQAGLTSYIDCIISRLVRIASSQDLHKVIGLTSFVAERRRKEIGVRKVLGASVLSIWNFLSKDFVVLVVLSILVSIPISTISSVAG